MTFDYSERIGGGQICWVQVVLSDKDGKDKGITRIRARGPLYEGDILVCVDGKTRFNFRKQGTILIPFWDNVLVHAAISNGNYVVGPYERKNLIYQVFGSVYEALRYTYYLLEGQYGISFKYGEKGKLHKARTALEAYNAAAAAGIRTTQIDSLAEELFRQAEIILTQLGTDPRDVFKREARNKSIQMSTIYDCTGRQNVPSKRARAVAVENRLKIRRFNISCIEPHIIARRQTLKTLIEEVELYWEGIRHFLSLLFTNNGVYVTGRAMKLLSNRQKRERIDAHLEFYIREMAAFDILPFTSTAYYVRNELEEVRRCLTGNLDGKAITLLRRSWNSFKLRSIRTQLEDEILELVTLLFGKPTELSRKQKGVCDQAIFRLKNEFPKLFQDVDEAGFEHPVVESALACCKQAERELYKKTPRAVGMAKEWLKQATQLL